MKAQHRYIAGFSLRSQGLAIIVLPLLSFLGALAWINHSTSAEEDAANTVQRTLRAQDAIERIEVQLDRAATTAVLAGSEDGTVERTDAAEQALADRLAPILEELADELRDPEQIERLNRMRPAVDALVTRAATLGRDPIGFVLAVDAVRLELDALRAREGALLQNRLTQEDATRRNQIRVMSAAILLAILSTVAVALIVFTGIVRRVRAVQRKAENLAPRTLTLPNRPPGDEIDALAASIDEATKLLADRQSRLEDLVARQFRTQEEERRRVAYDLHDGLAQVATSAHQHLQAYAGRFPPGDPEAAAALDRGLALVKTLVSETRTVIGGLRPGVLDDLGLGPAINVELEPCRAEGRKVSFRDDLEHQRLPNLVETVLFRIAQEALNNIRKHAGESAAIDIILSCSDRAAMLAVYDDGIGFDLAEARPSASSPGKSIGLEAIRERATLAGGSADIKTRPGHGVRIVITIPITP